MHTSVSRDCSGIGRVLRRASKKRIPVGGRVLRRGSKKGGG